MGVVNSVGGDKCAHTTVKFGLLDFEYVLRVGVVVVVGFRLKARRDSVEGDFNSGGQALNKVLRGTGAPVKVEGVYCSRPAVRVDLLKKMGSGKVG